MGEYIKRFDEHSQYESYIEGEGRVFPNISYCWDNNEVHYNPKRYDEIYLTFTAIENCRFQFSTYVNENTLQYSIDSGNTWQTLTKDGYVDIMTCHLLLVEYVHFHLLVILMLKET